MVTMVSNVPLAQKVSAAAVVLLLLLGASPALVLSTTIVPEFVSGGANITLTSATFTGRTTVIALTSPSDVFELALIQDGFGRDTKFQYCWAEIHDTATGQALTWRAPCNPIKVDECSLVLTSDGDFRLEVAADGSTTAPFRSGTGGEGVVDVQLTDEGDLLLVKEDNSTVWQSSENIQSQQKCKEAFNSASRLQTSFAWLGLACSIFLSAVMALST